MGPIPAGPVLSPPGILNLLSLLTFLLFLRLPASVSEAAPETRTPAETESASPAEAESSASPGRACEPVALIGGISVSREKTRPKSRIPVSRNRITCTIAGRPARHGAHSRRSCSVSTWHHCLLSLSVYLEPRRNRRRRPLPNPGMRRWSPTRDPFR
jgi:hypothetical protein